jgi:hypothetical protein
MLPVSTTCWLFLIHFLKDQQIVRRNTNSLRGYQRFLRILSDSTPQADKLSPFGGLRVAGTYGFMQDLTGSPYPGQSGAAIAGSGSSTLIIFVCCHFYE